MREWGCWVNIGAPLPQGSVAQKLRSGHTITGPIEVDTDIWIENRRHGDAFLLEDSRLLSEWDQVLSLLWFEEDDGDSYDEFDDMDDDAYGLEELDGILPWPSKKRRR